MEYPKKVIDGIREAKRKETGKEPSDEEVEKIAFDLREMANIALEMAQYDWVNRRDRFNEMVARGGKIELKNKKQG